jgi:hypothetical protein
LFVRGRFSQLLAFAGSVAALFWALALAGLGWHCLWNPPAMFRVEGLRWVGIALGIAGVASGQMVFLLLCANRWIDRVPTRVRRIGEVGLFAVMVACLALALVVGTLMWKTIG